MEIKSSSLNIYFNEILNNVVFSDSVENFNYLNLLKIKQLN